MATRAIPFSAQRLSQLGLAALLLLGACSEPEVILVGKRENIRAEGAVAGIADAGVNQSRAISLPAPQSNANWAQSIGTPSTRVRHPALNDSLTQHWATDIGAGDSRRARITANPVVSNDTIFTLDAGSLISAVNSQGAILWQTDIKPARDGAGEATGGGLAVADGVVFVSHGYGVLVALDAATGAEIWRQALGGTGSGAPAVYKGIVYVMASDDTGWALSAKTGRVLWRTTASADVSNVLGAPAPAVSDDFVLFGFGSGDVQAIFRRGGLRRWSTAVVGERPGYALSRIGDVTGAPVIFGDVVYVGNQSGRLIALELGLGSRVWTAADGVTGPVFPAGNSVFAISDQNALLRLDASSGERIWAQPLPSFVKDRPRKRSEIHANHGPILAGERIYVASSDGLLRAFDPEDGALLNEISIPGGASTAPVVANETLFVVTTKGQLIALR